MNPLFLVDQCYNLLPASAKDKPWELTEHGRKVLQTEDELNAYIAAYGEMHIVKCKAALQNFPFNDLGLYSYEIFDWGCGQGLATLALLDMLQERSLLSRLKRIHLIEPSRDALNRATMWVKQNAGPGIEVIALNSYIPNNKNAVMDNVTCSSRISINLFSNILDIRSISLSWLSNKTASLANTNYMVCIGPKFTQNTNTRIADFCGYFNPDEYYSNINAFPYSYTTRTHHAYGCETRCFVHHRDNPLNTQYQECAVSDANADPYDYTTEVLNDIVDDKILKFYNKLRQSCASLFDVYFHPDINCDTVDFVLTSRIHGVILINVCERLEDLNCAFEKIETIKNNLFSVHLKTLKIDSVINSKVYNCVKTALYFPYHSHHEINSKIEELNESNKQKSSEDNEKKQEKDYFAYLYRFTESSNLKDELAKIKTHYFKYEYYSELVNLISTQWHSYKEGDLNFNLSQKQKEIVRDNSKRIRVKGVAGCGKTQVVANRAVEQHLKTGDRVLILTFNISLIQYIRMRINQVPADFSPNKFEIINYHQFFKSKANQYSNKAQLIDFDNPKFFDQYHKEIKKYKTIIIDEIQDFKTEWIQSIVHNFLEDNGSISVFGDGEQNIFGRELEANTGMPSLRDCGFPGGKWTEMSERISMRILNPQIASLSSRFAQSFLKNISQIEIQNKFIFEEYFIKYWYLNKETSAVTLAGNIRWIISEYHIETKDIVVLGTSINLLRNIEAAYVGSTNQSTMITFETSSQYAEVTKDSSSPFIQKDLDEIRRAAKTHFTTDCKKIKMSTIHSFKGWESKTIILILQPDAPTQNLYGIKQNSPALIYTALTRAMCNLFILNIGNSDYHSFFSNNIQ